MVTGSATLVPSSKDHTHGFRKSMNHSASSFKWKYYNTNFVR